MDTAAANALLDAWFGGSKAAGMPASFDLALYDAHPDTGGVELDATGGYARVSVPNDAATWPAASGGVKTSTAVNLAGTATYGTAAKFWALYANGLRWFTMPLEAEVSEPTDTVTLTVALTQDA